MKTIEAKGSFFDVGQAVGEATRDDVRFVREEIQPFLQKQTTLKTREDLLKAARPLYAVTRPFFPPADEYLRGLARASGLALEDLFLTMFDEDLLDAYPEKCSTLAVKTGKGWVIGHNEDYDPHYLGRLSLLDLSFNGWPRLLAVSYPGKFPGVGGSLNARGLGMTNNSLVAAAVPGISNEARNFRASLSSTLAEALEALTAAPIPLPQHFSIVSAVERRAVSVEISDIVSADRMAEARDLGAAPMVHTNTVRYLSLKVADGCSQNSRDRQAKLEDLAIARPPRSPEEMMTLLSEHDGLLNRRPEDLASSITLATVVIRPETGELWVREYGTDDRETGRFSL